MKYANTIMKLSKIIICFYFFTSLICGCSTTRSHPQKDSYAKLREIEKDNEYLMSGLDRYLKELDELRTFSLSMPVRDRKLIDSRLEELHRRRLRDVQDLNDKIKKYENDLAAEKAFYNLLK